MHHPRALLRAAHARAVSQPDTLGDGDCERLHDGLLGQPVNTLTSGAYVGVGLWLAARTRRLPRRQRGAAGVYGAMVALTGVGSIAYHGPQFPGAQLLHDLPVVGVVGLGAAVPLIRWRRGEVPVPGWSRGLGAALATASVVAGAAYVGGGTDSSLCRPDSVLQLHGLWHIATAAATTLWGAALWPVPESGADRAEDPADDAVETGVAGEVAGG